MVDVIKEYFSEITPIQEIQMQALDSLYRDWNAKINVISRRDIDNLYVRHVLHSLAIAKFWGSKLVPGSSILDIGTGGGFPGIPLAIMFPQCHFHLLDRITKKNTCGKCRVRGTRLKKRIDTTGRYRRMPRAV